MLNASGKYIEPSFKDNYFWSRDVTDCMGIKHIFTPCYHSVRWNFLSLRNIIIREIYWSSFEMARIRLLRNRAFWIILMVLNKDFLHVSILIKANDEDVIKTNTVDIEDDTFTLPSSSKELSIISISTPIIRSVDSRSTRCQNDGSVPNKVSTTCREEGITDNQELEASTISGGSETPDTGVLEQSIENDTSAITTSAMDATLHGLYSDVPPVQLIGLYHMVH